MIIKSSRMPAADGADKTLAHVFHGRGNERIEVIQGCEQDVRDMVTDARAWRRKYAMRHFKISPKEMPENGHIREAVELLAQEFNFDTDGCVIVGHRKARHNDTGSPVHYHVYVPEVDPATGRVLSSRWSYARQEKVSRLLEVRFGHAVTQGRFNASVLQTLRADGFGDDADLLEGDGLDPDFRPNSSYPNGLGPEVLRKTKRAMPDIVQAIQDARLLSDGPDAFRAGLAEQGIRIVAGQKRGRWSVEVEGEDGGWAFSGALHRLLKIGVAEADSWILKKHGENFDEPGTGKNQEIGLEAESADGEKLGQGRLRRPSRGSARTRGAEADGYKRNDPDHRGSTGQRQSDPSSHEFVGQPRDDRRGERTRQDRRTPPGERGGSKDDQREIGRDNTAAIARDRDEEAENRRRAELLKRLLAVAALEQHFRKKESGEMLDFALRSVRRPPPHRIDTVAANRTVRASYPTDDERRRAGLRFRAVLLKKAYSIAEYLPVDAVLNMRRVDVDPQGRFVLLTLHTGTQLIDTGDRVTVRGEADDVAIAELVGCCERRGWAAVELTGDDDFRIAASRELLRRGIEVADCPLSHEEQEMLKGGLDAVAQQGSANFFHSGVSR